MKFNYLVTLGLLCFLSACKNEEQSKLTFKILSADQTGIDFANTITDSDSLNFYTNEYMYIGSGVGVGDFNNDGLKDVFFAASQSGSKLYINKGNLEFEDITEPAGIKFSKWNTGVSVCDINQDGFDDIYVCVSHDPNPQNRKNLLYINQKNGTFLEQAEQYGLADQGFSTQAAFLDYDQDGDLDLYVLNHVLFDPIPNRLTKPDTTGNGPGADKLYKNNGDNTFTDVSIQTGIKENGYGLGLAITDINQDGYPDIYVANDYIGNDVLWLNNQNGTFRNAIAETLMHQSYNAMGVDIGDLDNDLQSEIMVLDMAPYTNERKKMMALGFSNEKYDIQMNLGFQPQFARNMLHWNRGINTENKAKTPLFSEIGNYSGIAETDWSWSVLFADFNNDSWKDIYITNGLAKDLTNNDFLQYTSEIGQSENSFFSSNSQSKYGTAEVKKLRDKLDENGPIKLSNFLYLNNTKMQFEDITKQANIAEESISHGAVYVDLDNDGDLDIITNNVNENAFVLENLIKKDNDENYLNIELMGSAPNLKAIGAKVTLYAQNQHQTQELNPVRGYASSVDQRLHFGLGNKTTVDSIIVTMDNKKVVLRNKTNANQFLKINLTKAEKGINNLSSKNTSEKQWTISKTDFKHTEREFFDYYIRSTQTQKYSQLGPALEVGDLNADGLEDYYIGGAIGQNGRLYFQNSKGTFTPKNLDSEDLTFEDLEVKFADIDADKDLDIILVGGSSESNTIPPVKIYKNNGKGDFERDLSFPDIRSFSQTMAIIDFDKDGDLDIFIGGKMDTQNYPKAPKSYLLENRKGKFMDIAEKQFQNSNLGMVNDAIWQDLNNDTWPELIVVSEWMSPQIFENKNGILKLQASIKNTSGLWRSIAISDINHDGKMDIIFGNLGQNNKYHASDKKPLMLTAKDLNGNGYHELIPSYFIKNNLGDFENYPDLNRTQFEQISPAIKKTYTTHSEYSKATISDIISRIGKENSISLEANELGSLAFINQGNFTFKKQYLPKEAQQAPLNTMLICDINNDGIDDLITAGNEYQIESITGRYDASFGDVFIGSKNSGFSYLKTLGIKGDIKNIKPITIKGKKHLLVARNNENLVMLGL